MMNAETLHHLAVWVAVLAGSVALLLIMNWIFEVFDREMNDGA